MCVRAIANLLILYLNHIFGRYDELRLHLLHVRGIHFWQSSQKQIRHGAWDTLLWHLYMGMKHLKCSDLSVLSPTKSCLIHSFIYLFLTGWATVILRKVWVCVYTCVFVPLFWWEKFMRRFPFSHECWIRKGMLWACIAPWLSIKLLQKHTL